MAEQDHAMTYKQATPFEVNSLFHSLRTGLIWSRREAPVTSHAAAFCTDMVTDYSGKISEQFFGSPWNITGHMGQLQTMTW